MREGWGALAVAAASVLLLAPAGTLAATSGPSPALQSLLTVGMSDEMKTRNLLSPVAQDDPYTTAILARVYDTAVQRNATTGAIVPRLAIGEDANGNGALDPGEVGDFGMSPSSSTITVFYDFTNARFHDGTPVTSMDVLFSYHVLALHSQMNGPLRVLMDLGGGPGSNHSVDRWLWVLPTDDGDGNPSTAALRFSPQFPYADFSFATLGVPILPRDRWEGTGSGRHSTSFGCSDPDWGRAIYPEGDARVGRGVPVTETTYKPFNLACAQAWQMTDADVVGSGHFRFGTWSFGAFARLDANLDYAFGPPKISGILFKIYRNPYLGVFALTNGEIDFLFRGVPPETLPDLLSYSTVRIVSAPSLFPPSIVFNMRRLPFGYDSYPPTDRLRDVGFPFRQAMGHLVDKGAILRVLLQGNGSIADGMIAPTNDGWHNTSLPSHAYDPSRAAALLDNAGWTDTDADGWREFPRLGDGLIEILTPQADYDAVMASAGGMIAAAARSIGVNLISKPTAFGSIVQAVNVRDFDIAILGPLDVHPLDPWTLMRGDPDYLVDMFHSSNQASGRNVAGFWDTPFDMRAEVSRADAPSRAADVRWAEGILADRSPVIPLYYMTLHWAYRADRFAGWQLVASTLFNYWSLQGLEPVDNAPPVITLVSPAPGSLIRPGTPIDLEVNDTDLVSVEYSVDGVPPSALPSPYDVPTDAWSDGTHFLAVRAADSFVATLAYYTFRVDGTPPRVLSVSPASGSEIPAGRTPINVTFSEAVNRTSAEAAFSLVAGSTTWGAEDGTFSWANNSTSFRYILPDPLPEGTAFEVRLSGTLTDEVGNPMDSPFTSRFMTARPLLTSPWFLGGIALAVLSGLLVLLLLVRRRRKQPRQGPQS